MPIMTVSWIAECATCMSKLAEEHMDDHCPDPDSFDTTLCEVCEEEVCKKCCDSETGDIHPDCKTEEDENDSSTVY